MSLPYPPRLHWRPRCHLLPRSGWMNDPCGPLYSSVTRRFHLFFQWNPYAAKWDTIHWGGASSPDLVHWDVQASPALAPGDEGTVDARSVFTGYVLPRSVKDRNDQSSWTAFYTGVTELPIHHTLPYKRGSETIAMATSIDAGVTWERKKKEAVLDGPPHHLSVRSWRDPYIAPWPALDRVLRARNDQQECSGEQEVKRGLYAIISGSLLGGGPDLFLYQVDLDDLSKWTSLGPLVRHLPCNTKLPESSCNGKGIDVGQNWEVSNFFSLQGEEFIIAGAEHCQSREWHRQREESEATTATPPPTPSTAPHAAWTRHGMWIKSSLTKASTSTEDDIAAQLHFANAGLLDWGCLYAATTFEHQGRRLMWGWLPEDDLDERVQLQQGWSGCMSLPRELFLRRDRFGQACVGIRLAEEVKLLRKGARLSEGRDEEGNWPEKDQIIQLSQRSARRGTLVKQTSDSWELEVSLTFTKEHPPAGLLLLHSQDFTRYTTITYDAALGRLQVDRSHQYTTSPSSPCSPSAELIHAELDFEELTPASLQPSSLSSSPQQDDRRTLSLRIILDGSVLEIFAQDFIAISTRVYTQDPTVETGLSLFAYATPTSTCQSIAKQQQQQQQYRFRLWDGLDSSGC